MNKDDQAENAALRAQLGDESSRTLIGMGRALVEALKAREAQRTEDLLPQRAPTSHGMYVQPPVKPLRSPDPSPKGGSRSADCTPGVHG